MMTSQIIEDSAEDSRARQETIRAPRRAASRGFCRAQIAGKHVPGDMQNAVNPSSCETNESRVRYRCSPNFMKAYLR